MSKPRIPCVHGIDRELCPLHALAPAQRVAVKLTVNVAPEVVDHLRENARRRRPRGGR